MGILIKNIFLTEVNFQRAPKVSSPIKYSFKVQVGFSVNDKENIAQVNLKLELKETTKNEVTMTCCVVGIFDITEKDTMPLSLDDFLSINGPAIIFPYVREVVSNISLHAGIDPIFIPTINFKEISDKKKQEMKNKLKSDESEQQENNNNLPL